MKDKSRKLEGTENPIVKVRHRNYQPSVAELREDVNISTTPEQLAKAVVRDVVIFEVKKKCKFGIVTFEYNAQIFTTKFEVFK